MDTKLPTAQEAAIGFAKRLRAQDLAEVIDFDSRVVVLQNFTNSAAELEAAIKKTSAGGSTSLYNAVYIALKDLKKVVAKNTEEIRRQAIVVLSDGEDTSSLLPFEEVLDLAKRSETAIYAIGLRAPDGPGTHDQGIQGSGVRAAAVRAGNRRRASFFPNQLSELAGVYGQISDELSSQYTVGYTSRNPKRDGAWRRVVVRVTRPSMTARTKHGLLRADDALTRMNVVPLALYAAALVAYAWHFAQRNAVGRPRRHDAAGRRRAGAHLRHRHADDGGRARAGGGRDVRDLDVRVAAGARPISTSR